MQTDENNSENINNTIKTEEVVTVGAAVDVSVKKTSKINPLVVVCAILGCLVIALGAYTVMSLLNDDGAQTNCITHDVETADNEEHKVFESGSGMPGHMLEVYGLGKVAITSKGEVYLTRSEKDAGVFYPDHEGKTIVEDGFPGEYGEYEIAYKDLGYADATDQVMTLKGFKLNVSEIVNMSFIGIGPKMTINRYALISKDGDVYVMTASWSKGSEDTVISLQKIDSLKNVAYISQFMSINDDVRDSFVNVFFKDGTYRYMTEAEMGLE